MDIDGSVFRYPTLKKDFPVWYYACWALFWVLGIGALSLYYIVWEVAPYKPYEWWFNANADFVFFLMVLMAIGAFLAPVIIGTDKIEKEQSSQLRSQVQPMPRDIFIQTWRGLTWDTPIEHGKSVYSVMARADRAFRVRIEGKFYLELREFEDSGRKGRVIGENLV